MSPSEAPRPRRRLTPPSPDDGKRLRAFFQEAGYDLDTLRGGLGFSDLASFRVRKFLLSRASDPSRIDIVVQWFTCGMPALASVADKVIPAWVIELCESCGLLVRDGDSLHPTAMLSPFENFLIASDPITKLEADASDLIVWPNATTNQMSNAAIPRAGGAVLDLGCGTGALSVAAAAKSTHVTATDLNPRAAEFTAFNARLNGVGPIKCLTGNCFDPVAGRKFDQILCNPPFFLTPSTGLLYCENPMELDLFARRLMHAAPAHLNDGGFFQMLFEWVELAGTPWRERLSEWAEGLDCDVWIVKTYTMTPIEYGKERYSQKPGGQDAVDAAFADWIGYYRQQRIEAVHGGFVNLRRRSGANWIRMEEDSTVTLAHPAGELILHGFAAQDLIASTDESLLSARLRLHDRVRLRQYLRQKDANWAQSGLALTAPGAFGRELEMPPLVADFVGRFDGTRTVRELILDLEQRVDADRERVTKECLEVARKLLERGFLARAIE